jgi:hypothetical protein
MMRSPTLTKRAFGHLAGQGRRPPELRPAALRRLDASGHPFSDQVALELGHRTQRVEEEPTGRCGSVDALVEHHQVHAKSLELRGQRREVPHGAGKPVELSHGHHVEATASGIGEELVERRPAVPGAADAMVDILCGDLEATSLGVARRAWSWGSVCWSDVDTRAYNATRWGTL